jgi:hypothetical protein
MSEVPNIDGVIERAVESANTFHEKLRVARSGTDRFRMVMERVEKHDIVVAVWQDASERNGVGFRLIKGQQKLATIAKRRSLGWLVCPVSMRSRPRRCTRPPERSRIDG